jgi:hypothetical protein
MSRVAAGETVVVKPQSNLFTWLALVAVVLHVAALALIWLRFPTDP